MNILWLVVVISIFTFGTTFGTTFETTFQTTFRIDKESCQNKGL
jgi:hypothetical protein